MVIFQAPELNKSLKRMHVIDRYWQHHHSHHQHPWSWPWIFSVKDPISKSTGTNILNTFVVQGLHSFTSFLLVSLLDNFFPTQVKSQTCPICREISPIEFCDVLEKCISNALTRKWNFCPFVGYKKWLNPNVQKSPFLRKEEGKNYAISKTYFLQMNVAMIYCTIKVMPHIWKYLMKIHNNEVFS